MNHPPIIAFEANTPDETGYPVSVTWTLPSGEIKSSLIIPDEEWQDEEEVQGSWMDFDPDFLDVEGHAAKAILEEMQRDLAGETLFTPDIALTQQCMQRLYEAVDSVSDWKCLPIFELFDAVSAEELELSRHEFIELLGLEPHRAESQVRLWLELSARLLGSAVP
jgi:hypothetical protein